MTMLPWTTDRPPHFVRVPWATSTHFAALQTRDVTFKAEVANVWKELFALGNLRGTSAQAASPASLFLIAAPAGGKFDRSVSSARARRKSQIAGNSE